MQISRTRYSLVALIALLGLGIVLSLGVSSVALAQEEETATPADPVWRGFSTARAALEEEFNTDLTYVRNWTFAQSEWKVSIDSCNEDVATVDYRPVYFGWDFVITSLQNRTWRVRVSFDLQAVTICTREEAPAASGTPGATIPPVSGSGATGAFELGGHVLNLTSDAKTAMDAAGMTWVKKQVRWGLSDGTGQSQAYIDIAKANNFKIMLSIVGVPGEMSNFDTYIDFYAAHVAEVAKLGPDAIEVWNEPNIDREWPIGLVSGENYTRLLRAAYTAIKAANPNVMVISGAPSPTGFAGSAGCAQTATYHVCNDDVFFQQMAQAGAPNFMDCVGSHYNEGIVSPNATSGDPRDNFPTRYFGGNISRARAYITQRPICFTELGYVTPQGYGPIAPNFAWGANTTVAQQAQWLAEAASLSASLGYVRVMIVWNINFPLYDANDPQAGYAIIRPDGTCPACTALGAVMKK
ncbi:MAG: glycoside hydrolase family 5 protein [Anaerolineae bacterium]|nr:glycoside hydrolase family 5 protein [Anaerolineae bacterium]